MKAIPFLLQTAEELKEEEGGNILRPFESGLEVEQSFWTRCGEPKSVDD